MNILIMGGPGAGKGTMSAKIVEAFNVNHISTGDIFRSEIGKQTELGMMAKSYMENLEDKKNGFLLDGYPRTLDQAKAFDELSKGSDLEINKVILLNIELEELTNRITGRRLCKDCGEIYHMTSKRPAVEGVCDKCGGELYQRKDDTVESLQVRLDEYNRLTAPVMNYYADKGLVYTIEANQPMENVWADVKKALEK